VVASITDDGTATANGTVIAEWATGATLNNGDVLAGPRLAFISGSREVDGVSSQTAGIIDLTADGTQMLLNAVDYMAVPEPSTSVLAVMGLVGLVGLALRRKR
jgi:MYXO-CTERM domain-containing protein